MYVSTSQTCYFVHGSLVASLGHLGDPRPEQLLLFLRSSLYVVTDEGEGGAWASEGVGHGGRVGGGRRGEPFTLCLRGGEEASMGEDSLHRACVTTVYVVHVILARGVNKFSFIHLAS